VGKKYYTGEEKDSHKEVIKSMRELRYSSVVEHLPSLCKALGSSPNTRGKKKKKHDLPLFG
jgi:hypothetical protein